MSNLQSFRFLADENLSTEFVEEVRCLGLDVVHTSAIGLNGKSDHHIVQYAQEQLRVIITQDADFGKIVFTSEIDFTGIIYLRPVIF